MRELNRRSGRKCPDTMSFTSAWLPEETARPKKSKARASAALCLTPKIRSQRFNRPPEPNHDSHGDAQEAARMWRDAMQVGDACRGNLPRASDAFRGYLEATHRGRVTNLSAASHKERKRTNRVMGPAPCTESFRTGMVFHSLHRPGPEPTWDDPALSTRAKRNANQPTATPQTIEPMTSGILGLFAGQRLPGNAEFDPACRQRALPRSLKDQKATVEARATVKGRCIRPWPMLACPPETAP